MTDADLIARYDGRAPRYTSYPTAPHFTGATDAGVYAQWLAELPADAALSLYLHVPFCDRLCFYCGCNTSVVRLEGSHRAYGRHLISEIERVAAAIGRRGRARAVHWGGGTPTMLPADVLVEIMARLRALFAFDADAEIAIELDPTRLPADRLAALREMGVTRISLGVQDLDPAVQAAIGRRQSYEETEACARAARTLGVHSLNLDLIYGLPLQNVDSVTRTARQALQLGADRVAVFGYAHVPWMKKHQAVIPDASLPDALARFEQCQAIHRVLTEEGGYLAIGLDHYAKPDDSMAKAANSEQLRRGFQGYTTDDAPVLLGFGASAIGQLPGGYVQNAPTAAAYNMKIERGGLATVRGIALRGEDRMRREAIERLMCALEVDLVAVAQKHRADPAGLIDEAAGVARFAADGLAHFDGRRIVVTEKGRPFLRSIAALFDAYLARDDSQPRHARAI
ncbi:MAG: oxygen-independent coproporphyrinogen III oxidase [Pseudomonadota bacterium]|nr:oxygen-independent coproporphyrinogen III oxidase [Pseudomonadota bacterium]